MQNKYRRISNYYSGADGVQLAVDLYLPPADKKIPAVMYAGRAPRRERFAEQQEILEELLANDYAVVLPDLRGIGASFGRSDGFHSRLEARDLKVLMETMAGEDWCDGNFGMLGGSNNGFIQDLTAAERPAPLKAVIPCDCHPDFYYQDYPNGASRHIEGLPGTDQEPEGIPVDADTDGRLAAEAKKEHASNLGFLGQYMANMHRDTVNPKLGTAPQMEIPVWDRMDAIKYSGIKYYKNGAWYDPGAAGAIYAYKVFDGKLLIGPWRHCEMYLCNSEKGSWYEKTGRKTDLPNSAFPWEKEYLRFFDFALKGIENDWETEPPVRYYTRGEESGKEWKYAADLPLDTQRITSLYLGGEKSGTIDSRYDGTLLEMPEEKKQMVSYKTERDITLYGKGGTLDRRIEDGFAEEARKCLTFTSAPFEEPVEITGIPTLELDVTSDHEDGLFLAVLEEVYADGGTCFLTEGAIRASHAKYGRHTAYLSMGLPYHPGLGSDLAKLNKEQPLHLDFTMEALSQLVQAGSRLRLSVFCAEKMYQQPECVGVENPVIGLQLGESVLKLPVIAADVSEFKGTVSVTGADGSRETGVGVVYVFKRAVYVQLNEKWHAYPCRQAYPLDDHTVLYQTESFTVKKELGESIKVSAHGEAEFELTGKRPARKMFQESRPWLHPKRFWYSESPVKEIQFKDQWVATVPVETCQEGFPDIGPYHTMDLMLNLKLPKQGAGPYPCIVGIHGHGGDYDCFERLTNEMLEKGYAVASVDYRATPPNRWPSLLYDVKGAIRFLKAHAEKYHIDRERIGIMGGSCGGHLSAFIAATNGDPKTEGDIGGNTEYDSKIRAAAIYFPWTDALGFGEDIFHQYPGQLNKVMNSDGPYAPPGYMFGFSGDGKGLGALKAHMHEAEYQEILDRAIDVSPVSHVTKDSAPSVIIHGIYECGIQIPMNQSVRFFEKLTQKGVKSLLLCNNNGFFGEDEEVKKAVVDFMKKRV